MKNNKIVLAFIMSLSLLCISAQGQNVRGFYITDIGNWLGNTMEENKILNYALGNGFNYILYYDLRQLDWTNSVTCNQLALFNSRARTQFGISQIGAVVETHSFVTQKILPYNNTRTDSIEKFDVINQEFEFWSHASIGSSYCAMYLMPNGYTCDTAGAWKFALSEFKKIDSLCSSNGMMSEYYLGWPNQGQMQQLVALADRILLHSYRPTDHDVYIYSKSRLSDIASLGTIKKVMCLFSSEPVFMGPWLTSNPQTKPYQTYSSGLNAETAAFKQYIDLEGYQWFTYGYMPKTSTASATITAGGSLIICAGTNVILNANSGTQYLWSPGGETTSSITVSTSGSFTVRVTDTSGIHAYSFPTEVTTISGVSIPAVSADGPTLFCPGGSVQLTSDTGSSYLWSNGLTTQSITVTTSGMYSVTTGGTCGGTSIPVAVNAQLMNSAPVISPGGSINICQGTDVVLTSSSANSYLWSNGETTQSISVSSPGSYSVQAFHSPGCSAHSNQTVVNVIPSPATPTIGANGSSTLSGSNPTVTITSSTSTAYLWSTGQTTRSIQVSTPGTYNVTVTGSNGCKATSPFIAIKKSNCTPPAIPIITINGSNVISPGQTVTLTSSAGSGYLWSNGFTSRSIIVSSGGVYSVRVYNSGSCFSTSPPVSITVLTPRIQNENYETTSSESVLDFDIFPNPAKENISIRIFSYSGQNSLLKVLDLSGREIKSEEYNLVYGENKFSFNVADLPLGIYFACLVTDQNKKILKLIID